MHLQKKILVIDDEPKIVEVIEAYLKNSGYKVYCAFDGTKGLETFFVESPDMVLLDLMLPGCSGEHICKEIRKVSEVPIIMLTAKVHEDDKVYGFELGADDYLTKPFSYRELLARMNRLFGSRVRESVICQDLEVNFTSYEVKKSGEDVHLTPNEFKLLSTLMKNPKKTFTREELIQLSFGIDFDGYDRTIDSHIKNLRAKIECDTAEPRYILTVRGIGYRFGG